MTSPVSDTDLVAPSRTPASLIKAATRALRPKQWTKNGLLFAALIFSGEFTNPWSVQLVLLGFIAFSLISSSGYIFNDYLDREADRRHPKKRHRPIASGALPAPVAVVELCIILGIGVGLAWWLSPMFLLVAMAYLATTLSYSFYLKHIVILDVMFISAGFVWRAVAGAVVIGVAVSPWLFLCTGFLALFLGFHKRRAELVQLGDQVGTRRNLVEYSPQMLDQFQPIVTANAVLCYALYTILGTTPWMALTLPIVLYGIFRYIYLVDQKGVGAAPDETLYKDAPILITCVLYAATATAVMFLAPPLPH